MALTLAVAVTLGFLTGLGIGGGSLLILWLTMVFCVFHVPAGSFFMMILLICVLLSIASAITTIFDYKQPYEIMEIESYSVYVAYAGLFNGVIGAAIGAVLPMLFKYFDFYFVTGCSIVSAAVCLFAAGLLMYRLKMMAVKLQLFPLL